MVRMTIRDRRGISQLLPTQFFVKHSAGKLAVRSGITIPLSIVGENESAARNSNRNNAVTMKPLPPLNVEDVAQQKLFGSTETMQVAEFDLRDCFDITTPGKYKIRRFKGPIQRGRELMALST
jgi:hypothetical protein